MIVAVLVDPGLAAQTAVIVGLEKRTVHQLAEELTEITPTEPEITTVLVIVPPDAEMLWEGLEIRIDPLSWEDWVTVAILETEPSETVIFPTLEVPLFWVTE